MIDTCYAQGCECRSNGVWEDCSARLGGHDYRRKGKEGLPILCIKKAGTGSRARRDAISGVWVYRVMYAECFS